MEVPVKAQNFSAGFALALILLGCNAWADEPNAKRYSRGAIVPDAAQLQARISAQAITARRSAMALRALRGQLPSPATPNACSADASRFDWRTMNTITVIENQGACGDCWAFATAGAFEASLYWQSNQTTSLTKEPPDLDASEQQILDCTTPAQPVTNSCQGGWHDEALDYLKKSGGFQRDRYSQGNYTAAKAQQCLVQGTPSYFISNWDYVGNGVIPSDSAIKAALCEHGPIVTAVDSTGWDDYKGGVHVGKTSKNLTWSNIQKTDIDHEVVIIGWDDAQGVWIVKNSWGSQWGDLGFMLLKQGTANVGFNAAWVEATPIPTNPTPELKGILNNVQQKLKAVQDMKKTLIQQELKVLKD
jgi:cathepsin L